MIRIVLHTRPVSTNLYFRMHWSKRENIKIYLWHLVQEELLKQNCHIFFQNKVDILLIGHFKGKKALDSTNLFSTLKLVEDVLKKKLIVDDSPRYVGVTACWSRTNRPANYLELIVTLHDPHKFIL